MNAKNLFIFQCERLLPLSYFGPSTFSRRLSGEGSSAYVAEDKVAMYVQVVFFTVPL